MTLIFLCNDDGFMRCNLWHKVRLFTLRHKDMRCRLKQILFGGIVLGSSLFTGEIQPRTCSVSTVEPRGVVARAVDGSDAPNWYLASKRVNSIHALHENIK